MKRLNENMYYIIGICSLYLALALTGMTLIKSGHEGGKGIYIPLVGTVSWILFLGIFFYGLSFLIFTFFISKLQISVVFPIISGLSSVITVFIGMLFFKESLNLGQAIGVCVVIIGTAVVGFFS